MEFIAPSADINAEPPLQEILADPDIQLLMNADRVERPVLLALCREAAKYAQASKSLRPAFLQ